MIFWGRREFSRDDVVRLEKEGVRRRKKQKSERHAPRRWTRRSDVCRFDETRATRGNEGKNGVVKRSFKTCRANLFLSVINSILLFWFLRRSSFSVFCRFVLLFLHQFFPSFFSSWCPSLFSRRNKFGALLSRFCARLFPGRKEERREDRAFWSGVDSFLSARTARARGGRSRAERARKEREGKFVRAFNFSIGAKEKVESERGSTNRIRTRDSEKRAGEKWQVSRSSREDSNRTGNTRLASRVDFFCARSGRVGTRERD